MVNGRAWKFYKANTEILGEKSVPTLLFPSEPELNDLGLKPILGSERTTVHGKANLFRVCRK